MRHAFLCGEGTRDAPLTMSVWEAMVGVCVHLAPSLHYFYSNFCLCNQIYFIYFSINCLKITAIHYISEQIEQRAHIGIILDCSQSSIFP